jgi:hypothetical protein
MSKITCIYFISVSIFFLNYLFDEGITLCKYPSHPYEIYILIINFLFIFEWKIGLVKNGHFVKS